MKGKIGDAEDASVKDTKERRKMESDSKSEDEKDPGLDDITNDLSTLSIKREPVEDNELPDSPTNLESPSKGDKPEFPKEVVDKNTQKNGELLTRGPVNGVPTAISSNYCTNVVTIKDKKRGLEDDGNDPPSRYMRPGDEPYNVAYSSQTKDNMGNGRLIVKSPSTEFSGINFGDNMLAIASGLPVNQQPPGIQYNRMATTGDQFPMFPQPVLHHSQTNMVENFRMAGSHGNMMTNNNPPPGQNFMEHPSVYGRRETYVSESESESAKSPYSDQMYSPDNSSVKSINSPPPSNASTDSGIIGDLTVNSPEGSSSPPYDTATSLQAGYTTWEDTSSQTVPSPASSQSMASPPHMGGSPMMPQQSVASPPQHMGGSPMMPQQSIASPPHMGGSPMMPQQSVASPPHMGGSPMMPQQSIASPPHMGGSPMMPQQSIASPPHMGGSPMMPQQSVASPPHMGGSPMMPQAGSPKMSLASSPHFGNSQMMPQSMASTQHLSVSQIMPQSISSTPHMSSSSMMPQSIVSMGSQMLPQVASSATLSSVPQMMPQYGSPMRQQLFMAHQPVVSNQGISLPGHMAPQIMTQQMMSPQAQRPYVFSPATQDAQPNIGQLVRKQMDGVHDVDWSDYNIVMEVLNKDLNDSNDKSKCENTQVKPAQPVTTSMLPREPNVIARPIGQTSVAQPNGNFLPAPPPIPVTVVMSIPTTQALLSKPAVGKSATIPIQPQPPVFIPAGNQLATPQSIVVIVPSANLPPLQQKNERKKYQPIKPKPMPSMTDNSKAGSKGSVTSTVAKTPQPTPAVGNLNEVGPPGSRPLPPSCKPGQNQQTVHRQTMLTLARRTVANVSREKLIFQDHEGDTYLHVAVCKTDAWMVQALVERLRREKLDLMIDVPNKKRQTPLYLAVAANQPMMVNTLIQCNANPCSMAQVYLSDGKLLQAKAPIHVASSNGRTYLVTLQELIKSPDINLNIVNSEGHTALHCAILAHRRQNKNGQSIDSIPIIETLLKAGAEPNSQDKTSGKTPLMYAIEKRDATLVERMLCMCDSGVKLRNIIKSQTFDGNTCIKIAEGLKNNFHPDHWQRLINTLNAALNGDPPRFISGVAV